MNTARHIVSIAALLAAAAVAPLAQAEPQSAIAATAAASGGAPCGMARLTPLQRRLLDKAEQGVAPFVQFIHRTRAIYQLDAYEVAGQLEGWRQRRVCATAAATDAPAPGG